MNSILQSQPPTAGVSNVNRRRGYSAPRLLAKLLLCGGFIIAMYAQRDVALGDQGDFNRATRLFAVTPVGFPEEIPKLESPEFYRRYYTVWHREWILHWSRSIPSSAGIILLLPGVFANELFYSTQVVSLPLVAVFPKLVLLALLLFMVAWLEEHPPYTWVLYVVIGIPVVFMLTSTDYVVYLNSFYQEGPTLVFLIATLGSILYLKSRATKGRLILAIAATLLLGATKPGNLYWVVVLFPLISILYYSGRTNRLVPVAVVSTLAGILVTGMLLALVVTGSKGARLINPYHSLFMGVLQTSDAPAARLSEIGFDPADTAYIGISAFSVEGNPNYLKYMDRISFGCMAAVVKREPATLVRLIGHTFAQMQDLSLEYVGHYTVDDPRRAHEIVDRSRVSSKLRQWNADLGPGPLNLWSSMKYHCFPVGGWLVVSLFVFVGWFAFTFKKGAIHGDLALVGTLTGLGCALNTVIAVVGDGTHELIKHLLLSNVLYDLALIAFVASVALSIVDRMRAVHAKYA
jgi:hypothetical protein